MPESALKKASVSFEQLKGELRVLRDRYPKFHEDDIFVLWFLRAYLTDNDDEAAKAITGASHDKGVDALLIDDDARAVFVIQGKYHQKLGEKSEGANSVIAFANLAQLLHTWDDENAEAFLAGADPGVAHRVRLARKKVRNDKYRSWLYFVTTAKVSPAVQKDAQQYARKVSPNCRLEAFDSKRVMLAFRDYLGGVAPPIPQVELEVEAGGGVTQSTVAHRADSEAGIDTWVFSMRGDEIASLYKHYGMRLFARNIRGYLGVKLKDEKSKRPRTVNAGMVSTLKNEPYRFFYYNNGITIICDAAEQIISQGRNILQVGNPQIINGQQTTRTLAHCDQPAGKASVLVKVIRVPRDADGGAEAFEELVSRIVAGANWQNAIRPSDLMSNDRRQVDLERALRKLGYFYLRKRQAKGEIKQIIGNGQFQVVTKEEFAQASAGCNLDPHTIRSGLEKLFLEDRYPDVFPNSDPDYYLPRYWLMREVTWAGKGHPEWGYAKWMVLNFMWSYVAPLVKGRQRSRTFRYQCERQAKDLVYPLNDAINITFTQAQKYYRANRGTGAQQVDVSTFYKNRKGRHLEFFKFWESVAETQRQAFDKKLAKVRTAIESFEE